jgi:hypothetical protein
VLDGGISQRLDQIGQIPRSEFLVTFSSAGHSSLDYSAQYPVERMERASHPDAFSSNPTCSSLDANVARVPPCGACRRRKTSSSFRRIKRWEHEHVLEAMQERLYQMPQASRLRRQTAEHVFGTLKAWMGSTHFLTKTLPKVRTEMSLHVLAYNMKRAISILGVQPLIEFMKA